MALKFTSSTPGEPMALRITTVPFATWILASDVSSVSSASQPSHSPRARRARSSFARPGSLFSSDAVTSPKQPFIAPAAVEAAQGRCVCPTNATRNFRRANVSANDRPSTPFPTTMTSWIWLLNSVEIMGLPTSIRQDFRNPCICQGRQNLGFQLPNFAPHADLLETATRVARSGTLRAPTNQHAPNDWQNGINVPAGGHFNGRGI